MTELEGLIRYWEEILLHSRFLLEPSTIAHIEATIKNLKKLQKTEGGEP